MITAPMLTSSFTSSRFLYCRSPRVFPDGGEMNIYREHLWSGLYRKGNRKFTILPQKLTTYKLTNLQYGRSCWSRAVASRLVWTCARTSYFYKRKTYTSLYQQFRATWEFIGIPVSVFRVGNIFVSRVIKLFIMETISDVGQTVINNPNLFGLS